MTRNFGGTKVAVCVKKSLVVACTRSTCYHKGLNIVAAENVMAVLLPNISVHGTVCTSKKL